MVQFFRCFINLFAVILGDSVLVVDSNYEQIAVWILSQQPPVSKGLKAMKEYVFNSS